jgi:23S rRNA pseudouridine1911/1915/1917 synthase
MVTILYEDEHCLAVSKPAGMSTQAPVSPVPTAEDWLRSHLNPEDPGAAYVGTVHRLDRPVSGVLLFAKTSKAARRFSAQFENRQVVKQYWAIVEGEVKAASGVWEDWLTAEVLEGRRLAQRVAPGTPRARPARTRFERGEARELPAALSWLRLWPETGRMHQLRAQAAGRGLPIVGDAVYGSRSEFGAGAIALHARRLELRHPMSGEQLILEAAVPAEWEAWGIRIGIEPPGTSREEPRGDVDRP